MSVWGGSGLVRVCLIVHPAPHRHGFAGLVPNRQGVDATLIDPDAFVNTPLITAEAIEQAVRADIAELNAGIAGRVGTVIGNNVSRVQNEAVTHRSAHVRTAHSLFAVQLKYCLEQAVGKEYRAMQIAAYHPPAYLDRET